MKMGIVAMLGVVILSSCVTMNNGANWFYADFSAYDKNYKAFNVAAVRIGMSKDELVTTMNMPFNVQAATADTETIEYEKWRAVPGPDYVEERLLVLLKNSRVAEYRIVKDTVKTNPW